jgi:hypothetical protein
MIDCGEKMNWNYNYNVDLMFFIIGAIFCFKYYLISKRLEFNRLNRTNKKRGLNKT